MNSLLLPMPGNEDLARRISEHGDLELGEIETRRFPDGETYLRHLSPLDGKSVTLLCTLNDPDAKLVPLLFAAMTARELGARRVGLVAPYLAYMRQDIRFSDGEAISARLFAAQISAAFDWLVTVEPHLHRVASLDEVFTIPAVALRTSPLLAAWISDTIQDPVIIGPDSESRIWVEAVAGYLRAPYRVANKTRFGDQDVRVELRDLDGLHDRMPVVVDDVVSSGETLLKLANPLIANFASPPSCLIVHGLFSGTSYEKVLSKYVNVISTNTISHESNKIDISADLAAEISELI
jgi:ribose-phosphate pyrophosphokinase